VVYTTNAIESLNRSLRKVLKTKGSFPDDDAVLVVLLGSAEHCQEMDDADQGLGLL